jgi:diaminohydroxyphosphoribosylaminopyrimidine deaminase/5-amino-6-(5-phosphoribosylamino)uracil reductase
MSVPTRRTTTPPTDHMSRALAQARAAIGSVSPNPPVGAVLVKDGVVIGEGHTQPPGGDHAEIMALNQAGKAARGADLFVTLEPCAHFGRTPPCTDAIIRAGVARVHVAALDPAPHTDGRGVWALEHAGISVTVRESTQEARALIEAFAKHVTTGIPFVTAKFAMSLDGKIATRSGDARWISGPESRALAHGLRAAVDAVLVGIGTALADDPQMTVRDAPVPARGQPLRVVVDSRLRLPPTAAMLAAPGRTLVVTATEDAPKRAALEAAGAEVLTAPGADGRVDVPALLRALGQREVTAVLAEGGAGLLGTLFDAHAVDKVIAFVAPAIIGGQGAPTPVAGRGASVMPDVLRLERVVHRSVGDDVMITGYTS